ncbi:unnamed protein product [Ceutorhynchus assimilis]|uniref:Uncharacterized protein n=1 Tax=Ceutorhynchus assimilis TaxID=467358 RepID=A0A9N9MFA1_9CUCU|nr:unnamed protein product [Ceutorhynchus assimilis]
MVTGCGTAKKIELYIVEMYLMRRAFKTLSVADDEIEDDKNDFEVHQQVKNNEEDKAKREMEEQIEKMKRK